MRKWLLWIGLGLALGLAAVAVVSAARPYTYHGSLIEEDYPAPEFTLADGKGGTFSLAEQRGKLTLIFFGYVSCPDVCPTTLSQMKSLYRALGADAERVQVVFVTVDPERDTPEKVAEYVGFFDPRFTGLSGAQADLAPIWSAYGVYYQYNKTSPDDKVYTVDHSSQVYLVDAGGNLRLTYSFGTPLEALLDDVRHLLRKG